ncbi:MAG: alpha/beta fold hydrolase [Rudaea sp.]
MQRISGYVDVEGGKLYYEQSGEGHPLVLVHAGIADHRMWDEQFRVFAERFRVVRYDQRGFGLSRSEAVSFSRREDLRALLQHLGIERAHLLGLSMGGSLVTDFTLEYPDMVTALIPVAAGLSGHQPAPGTDAKAQYERERETEMETLWEKKEIERLKEMELELWVDGPLQPSDRVPHPLRERVREMNDLAYTHDGEGFKPQPLERAAAGRLGEIRVPTLVIVGDLDTTSVLDACRRLAEDIPGAREVIIPGAAHMVNMERPAEFNRIVLDFLATV